MLEEDDGKLYPLNILVCTTKTYIKSNGQCACGFYRDAGLTWSEAKDWCATKGGRLPEIFSEKENTDLHNLWVTNH